MWAIYHHGIKSLMTLRSLRYPYPPEVAEQLASNDLCKLLNNLCSKNAFIELAKLIKPKETNSIDRLLNKLQNKHFADGRYLADYRSQWEDIQSRYHNEIQILKSMRDKSYAHTDDNPEPIYIYTTQWMEGLFIEVGKLLNIIAQAHSVTRMNYLQYVTPNNSFNELIQLMYDTGLLGADFYLKKGKLQ